MIFLAHYMWAGNDESSGLSEVCVVVIVGGPMVAVAPDSKWPARVCHHPLPPDPGQHPLEPHQGRRGVRHLSGTCQISRPAAPAAQHGLLQLIRHRSTL